MDIADEDFNMYIGPTASPNVWDQPLQKAAILMEKEGKSPKDIKAATGYHRVNGTWKMEISLVSLPRRSGSAVRALRPLSREAARTW